MKNDSIFAGELNRGVISSREKNRRRANLLFIGVNFGKIAFALTTDTRVILFNPNETIILDMTSFATIDTGFTSI